MIHSANSFGSGSEQATHTVQTDVLDTKSPERDPRRNLPELTEVVGSAIFLKLVLSISPDTVVGMGRAMIWFYDTLHVSGSL